MDDLAVRAIEEAHELHAFFAAWFRAGHGPVPDFRRLEAALADDFRMVTPDGRLQDRATVVERVRAARAGAPDDFRITVREARAVWQAPGAVLLEFVEQQYRGSKGTSRRSTALLTDGPGAPNHVVWRHLQETWIGSD
jgi:hypothetical protein